MAAQQEPPGNCARCGRALEERTAFRFHTPGGLTCVCFGCAVRHAPMLQRSLLIALVVGTLLTAINQGDVLLARHWTAALVWKIPLTYTVPFIVVTLGALGAGRARAGSDVPGSARIRLA